MSGAVFAVGLTISEMTSPARVIAFFDITGAWEPSLLFVMIAAIAIYASAYWISRRVLHRPWAAGHFAVVPSAAWDLAGYCPGPAITASAAGFSQAILFSAAMVVGIYLAKVLDRRSR